MVHLIRASMRFVSYGDRKAVAAGVNIAYGTDSGVYPHGDNARQFAYMVRYGMTPLQAIRAATLESARLLRKENELGSITPGKLADLVALACDPLAVLPVIMAWVWITALGRPVEPLV